MNENNYEFQILDWSSYHKEVGDNSVKKFTIRLFGKTVDNKSIYVEVEKYKPYFYIEVPDNWTNLNVESLLGYVRSKMSEEFKHNTVKTSIVKRKRFFGFTAERIFTFARLCFNDQETLKRYQWAFERFYTIERLRLYKQKFTIYEANLDPILRCMHERELDACGWVSIPKDKCAEFTGNDIETRCDINISTDFSSLNRLRGRESEIQKFTIASIDIECISKDGSFPQPERPDDKIIMIATTFSKYEENDCYYRHVAVLGTCNDIEGADVEQCNNEEEVLLKWAKMINKKNPDCITGWNIFGFDEQYIKTRCDLLKIEPKVSRLLSRVNHEQSTFTEKKLASSALGDNILKYYDMNGRVRFDLMKVVQKDYKLESYKLDFVASTFFREIITKFEKSGENTLVTTKSTNGIKTGQYVTIIYNDGVADYQHLNGKKFRVLKVIDKTTLLLDGDVSYELLNMKNKIFWCQVKDDVKPNEIFKSFNGTVEQRTELAKYNIQDCELCNKLTDKLQVIINNVSMANVCNVPLTYLFMRGQGIKTFSLVAKKCRQREFLIQTIKKKKKDPNNNDKKDTQPETYESKYFANFLNTNEKIVLPDHENFTGNENDDEEDEGYEGAVVFPAKKGIYYSPIAVLDYSSLYPNSMRYRGLSHEMYVNDPKYLGNENYDYTEIIYNNNDELKTPAPPCTFAKRKDGRPAIIPEILEDLLNARKAVRKQMEIETDPFKKSVLNGLQLAFKITANSIYGQTGAPTSPIYMKEIAACTTAVGRGMLNFSKTFVETMLVNIINYALDSEGCNRKDEKYKKYYEYVSKLFEKTEQFNYCPDDKKMEAVFDKCENENDTNDKKKCHCDKTLCRLSVKHPENDWRHAYFVALRKKIIGFMSGYHIKPEVIYGDTDSVFIDLHITKDSDGSLQTDISALEKGIKLGMTASMLICTMLPYPMCQEYEKCLWPFAQLSKKRYVGNLYEDDINHHYQKCMGIVLKRRDNAQIVKIICGTIVDQLINKRNPEGAISMTKQILQDMIDGKYSMDKYVITKSLRENYKNRNAIAHAVLADRIAERDPGNKPLPNDRIPYLYVIHPKSKSNGNKLGTSKKIKELQGNHIDTPDYTKQHNLAIDYLFYITNQIMKPAVQFLSLVTECPEKIFNYYINNENNKRNGICTVDEVKDVTSYWS